MTSLTYQQFMDACFQKVRAGELVEAEAFLMEHWGLFPAASSTLYNIRYCLAALLGRPVDAKAILAEALAQGECWPRAVLLDDPDLISLHDDPEYLELVEQSHQAYERLGADSAPELVTIIPTGDNPPPYPLILVLHGRMGNAAETLPEWESLAQAGLLVAVAQSSQPLGNQVFGWDDPERAKAEIRVHLQNLQAQYPIDAKRILLGGFSQGGGLAVQLTLASDLGVRGFLAVAPFIQNLPVWIEQLGNRAFFDKRGVLVTGGQDHHPEIFNQLEGLMLAKQIPYRRDNFEALGHAYPSDFQELVQTEAAFLLAE